MSEQVFGVCNDCGGQSLLGIAHKCEDGGVRAGQRLAAELLDRCLALAHIPLPPAEEAKHGQWMTGAGLLWLYRIAYRVRSRMNGLESYKDRAGMARVVCDLGGELYK
jgi:hypothetical protein